MLSGKKIQINRFLEKTAIPDLTRESRYFSLKTLRTYLTRHKLSILPPTLLRYLHNLTKQGTIHSAGRGWYSTLSTPFKLDTTSVATLVSRIETHFPLLDFSIWSTEQLAAFGHHLTGKFVYFVHAERAAMSSVFDFLKTDKWNAYLNPTPADARKSFRLEDQTILVRPTITEAPVCGHFSRIESILVDFYVEIHQLALVDLREYQTTASQISNSGRLDLAALIRYAGSRRRLDVDQVLKGWIN